MTPLLIALALLSPHINSLRGPLILVGAVTLAWAMFPQARIEIRRNNV